MKVKVTNIAFSKNKFLVDCLINKFQDTVVNSKGLRLHGDALVEYLSDADAAIIGLEIISKDVLDRLPKLKVIAKYGVGLDNIDLSACQHSGIYVGWTGGVNKRSVAEMTLGFMLALCRNLYSTSNALKSGVWIKNGGFQLTDKTIGIIGFGNIGQEVFNLLKPFGCKVLVNDIIDINNNYINEGVIVCSKDEIFREADFVTVHVPFKEDTKNLIDSKSLTLMKPNAFLINTSRGGIVNEYDLKKALINDQISGAALDVYETEPPLDLELLSLPNLICTPHIGGNANEAVIAMGLSAIDHLVNYYQSVNKSI